MSWGNASWGDGEWGDIREIVGELYTTLHGNGYIDTERTIDRSRDTNTYGRGYVNNNRVLTMARSGSVHGFSGTINTVCTLYVKHVSPTSRVSTIYDTAITDRTSLSLVDFDLTFDEKAQAWYTQWFPEEKILQRQHELAIQIFASQQSDDPAATIYVEYDGTGNGVVDERSEPIHVNSTEYVYDVRDIPVSESGYYRLRIGNYGGYNDIYNINIGIVH